MMLSEIEQKGMERLRVRIPATFISIVVYCLLPTVIVNPSGMLSDDINKLFSNAVNASLHLTAVVLILSIWLKNLLNEPFLLFLASLLYATPYIIISANYHNYNAILFDWYPWHCFIIVFIVIAAVILVYKVLNRPKNQLLRYRLNCIARNAALNLICITLLPVLFFTFFLFFISDPLNESAIWTLMGVFVFSLGIVWAVIITDLIFINRPSRQGILKLWLMLLFSICLVPGICGFYEKMHLSKNIAYGIYVAILIVIGITVHLIEYRKERRRATPPKYKG